MHLTATARQPARPDLSFMPAPATTPAISPFLLKGFRGYTRRYLRKHFNRVRLAGEPPNVPDGQPLVVFMNHPAWWDPLIGLFLAERFFIERDHFAPIDAAALERYGVLKKFGFFGVDLKRARGAKAFIDSATGILDQENTALWLTPEGQFTDPRQNDSAFKPGIGHLAARLENATALPLAVEYPFWTERKPEALVMFGEAVRLGPLQEAADWTAALRDTLATTQQKLAELAIAREPEAFRELTKGRSGIGGVYDGWRRAKALLTGKRFETEHAAIGK